MVFYLKIMNLQKSLKKTKFNDGRKKMAKMPRGAKLIYNPSSAAPGFVTKNVFSLPGVPSILISMIENCKRYLVKGLKIHSKTINLFTVESNISKQLETIQKKYKKFVDIGKKIKKGDTILIVEAMKTMNHGPSTADGVVKEICVEDGQPVEYGHTIAIIE